MPVSPIEKVARTLDRAYDRRDLSLEPVASDCVLAFLEAAAEDDETVDVVAEWLVNNAGIVERPGYQRHDSWVFKGWSQLSEAERGPWRQKARLLLRALAARQRREENR